MSIHSTCHADRLGFENVNNDCLMCAWCIPFSFLALAHGASSCAISLFLSPSLLLSLPLLSIAFSLSPLFVYLSHAPSALSLLLVILPFPSPLLCLHRLSFSLFRFYCLLSTLGFFSNYPRFGKPADVFSLGISLLDIASGKELPGSGPGWQALRSGLLAGGYTRD